jgi:glutamine synthetase
MHTTQSLWKDGEPLFYDETGYARPVGHGPVVHRRTAAPRPRHPRARGADHELGSSQPGFEAPVNLVYSQRNRSACTRIPVTGTNAKAKRIEFRVPDPSSNPYLAFSAMLMAGLDGIRNKIEPPAPSDKDLYDLPPEEVAQVQQVPGSLPEVLASLERDHDYLLEGGVFTPDLIEMWTELKRTTEIDPVRLRPTPHEFALYYDC